MQLLVLCVKYYVGVVEPRSRRGVRLHGVPGNLFLCTKIEAFDVL